MKKRTPKCVLVTGADGFIGSHLVELLVANGITVKALAQYNSLGRYGWLEDIDPKILSNVELLSGDIRDLHFIQTHVKGCDTVLHLAALIGIPYSYHAVQSYVDTNITGTVNMLSAARDADVERFVQTSTSEVYGTAQFVPMTESHPLNAQSPYAASKIASDQLALSFARSFEMSVTILRPFNNFGPRQSTRAIIPTLISQFVAKSQNIKVGSLEPTRDFVFVRDTARAFMAVAQSCDVDGEVINVGCNHETSVGQIISLLEEITSRNVTITTEAQRIRPSASEVHRLWADNSKAKELLGWEPSYGGAAGFRRGLEECFAWYSEEARQIKNLEYRI